METLVGKHSSHPVLPWGSIWSPSPGRKVCMGAHSTTGQRLLLLHRRHRPCHRAGLGWLCWPPARLGSGEEAAFLPLRLHWEAVLCLLGAGQALLWAGHSGPLGCGRPQLDPPAGRWDQEELVYWQLYLSKIPESRKAFANPARS